MKAPVHPPLSKERMVAVSAQWRRFVAGMTVDEAIVRPVILQSWQRCRRAGFPAETLALCPIDVAGLARSTAENQELVDTAKQVMDKLAHSIHLSSSVVTLVDTDGLVLHVSATREDLEDRKSVV